MSGTYSNTFVGIACGIGAGALWGLVFLAPALARDFAPLQLAIGRYVFYGLFSALLLAPIGAACARDSRAGTGGYWSGSR